jgi:hypothetical protein
MFLLPFLVLTSYFFTPDLPPINDAQYLAGTWEGVLMQDRGGFTPEYDFQMTLRLEEGKVKGTSHVSVRSIYANWTLVGTLEDGVFHFEEQAIGRHTELDDLYWCLKEGDLHLKLIDYQWILYGRWWGESDLGDCVPGMIRMVKQVPQV